MRDSIILTRIVSLSEENPVSICPFCKRTTVWALSGLNKIIAGSDMCEHFKGCEVTSSGLTLVAGYVLEFN
jgi:hypothetical protein